MTKPTFDADGYQVGLTRLNGEPLPPAGAVFRHPTKEDWGGRRPGSGRKPSGQVQVVLRVSPTTRQRLKAKAEKTGLTMSAIAEAALDRALAR